MSVSFETRINIAGVSTAQCQALTGTFAHSFRLPPSALCSVYLPTKRNPQGISYFCAVFQLLRGSCPAWGVWPRPRIRTVACDTGYEQPTHSIQHESQAHTTNPLIRPATAHHPLPPLPHSQSESQLSRSYSKAVISRKLIECLEPNGPNIRDRYSDRYQQFEDLHSWVSYRDRNPTA